MKKIIYLIAVLLLYSSLNAQQVWYFGENAGIKFSSSGLPISNGSASTNPLNTTEGSAIIHDFNGNVIISTDGTYIYDKNNIVMPKGNGTLLGGNSATQSALILPVPGCNCSKYFIFTVASLTGAEIGNQKESDGLTYSVVDLNLIGSNNSIGDVTSTKNIPLIDTSQTGLFKGFSSEKLTAAKDNNGGYWVLAHGVNWKSISSNQKRFYAFHITAKNIGSCNSPTISKINTDCIITDIGENMSHYEAVGQMKFSSTAAKIGMANWGVNVGDSRIEIFDFNINTGVVNNAQKIENSFNTKDQFSSSIYGLEFSNNENFLYVTEAFGYNSSFNLLQYDISNTSINTTRKVIKNYITSNQFGFGALQAWKDGRIYVAKFQSNFLGVIQSPNLNGVLCNFLENGIPLVTGTESLLGLPTIIQDFTSCADPCNKCHNVGFYFDGKSYTMRKDTTIKIGCNTTFDFNPNKGCSTQDNVPVLGVSVTDAANNTPAWASSFITSNGNGSFNPPNATGIYTLTYYYGTTNPTNNKKDTCDKIVITINDTCTTQLPSCPCGEWGYIDYAINNIQNKFICSNGTALPLNMNNGDIFTLKPNYRCFGGVVGAICDATFKYDIYFANGGKKLGVTDIKNLKIDSCGLIRVVMKAYCSGIECPNTCEFTINVNCCTCSQTLSPMLYWNDDKDSSNLQCGSTVTNQLECFKAYKIKVKSPCGVDCKSYQMFTKITYPDGSIQTSTSIDGVPLTVASLTGNYVVAIKVKCGLVDCKECIITFKQTKPCQPPCDNCKNQNGTPKVQAALNSGATTAVVGTFQAATTVNAALMLGGGTDTYTQVRVNVLDVQMQSGKYDGGGNFVPGDPACLQCYNNPNQWASILGGSLAISGFTATSTTYSGIPTTNPYNNSREIVFNNTTPTAIPMGTNLNLSIQLPGVNPISCCCITFKVFLKVTYRNNKCEECSRIVILDVTECPRGNNPTGNDGPGGGFTINQTVHPQYRIASPNNGGSQSNNGSSTNQ